MPEASLAFTSLMAFAVLFGVKHGFDADHLACIDGLARLHSRRGRPRLSRYAGLLFSGGHGLAILAAASLFDRYGVGRLPAWLDPVGAWISIMFLSWVGIVNLRGAWQRTDSVPQTSPLARTIMRLPVPHGLLGSLLVGALFAFSLDALSLAAWFGLAGNRHGGMPSTLVLALCFVLGMVLTDAANGVLVASLIRRSESFVQRASRLFSVLVAGSALLVAGFGASKLASVAVDRWADGRELTVGLLVLTGILLGYAVARRLHRSEACAIELRPRL